MREIVLDTESTGLSAAQGHRIVEIGCVELVNHMPTGEVFHTYVNPERDMPEEAYNVHKLSAAFLSDKPLFEEIADALIGFLADTPLIIHNAEFDLSFLNNEFNLVHRPALDASRAIDTLKLARRKFPGMPNSLDALCRRFNVDNSSRTAHGALLDSELLAEVYLELIGGRQPGLSFAGMKSAKSAESSAVEANEMRAQRPKPLGKRLSAEEEQAHTEFIATLGEGTLWKKYL